MNYTVTIILAAAGLTIAGLLALLVYVMTSEIAIASARLAQQ